MSKRKAKQKPLLCTQCKKRRLSLSGQPTQVVLIRVIESRIEEAAGLITKMDLDDWDQFIHTVLPEVYPSPKTLKGFEPTDTEPTQDEHFEILRKRLLANQPTIHPLDPQIPTTKPLRDSQQQEARTQNRLRSLFGPMDRRQLGKKRPGEEEWD